MDQQVTVSIQGLSTLEYGVFRVRYDGGDPDLVHATSTEGEAWDYASVSPQLSVRRLRHGIYHYTDPVEGEVEWVR